MKHRLPPPAPHHLRLVKVCSAVPRSLSSERLRANARGWQEPRVRILLAHIWSGLPGTAINDQADFDAFWLICRCMQRTLPAQHP